MSGGGGKTTTIQDIPPEFKPYFTALFGSGFDAARQAQGPFDLAQPPSMGWGGGYGGPGMYPGAMGLGGMGGGFQNPYAGMMGGGYQPHPWGGMQNMGMGPYDPFRGAAGRAAQQGMGPYSPTSIAGGPSPGAGQPQSTTLPPGQAGWTGPPTPTPTGGPPAQPMGQVQGGPAQIAQVGAGQFPQQMLSTAPGGQPQQAAAPGRTQGGKASGNEDQAQPPGGPPAGGYYGTGAGGIGQGGSSIVGAPFPGSFTAPTNPLEAAGLWGKLGAAGQMGGLGQNLLGLGQAQASGAFLHPQSNPFLQATMNYAMQPAIEQFTRGVMPSFESQALQSGAFKGSSARDMAAATLASDFGRNLMGTTAAMGMENLARERQLQQGTGTMLDEAARLMQLPPEIIQQAGAGFRGFDQRMLDEQLLRFQEQQQAPFRPLMPLASIIQGTDIGKQITQMTPQPSRAATGITGALGGAGLGAGAAGALNMGGWGGAGMTGGGALAGMLGGLM